MSGQRHRPRVFPLRDEIEIDGLRVLRQQGFGEFDGFICRVGQKAPGQARPKRGAYARQTGGEHTARARGQVFHPPPDAFHEQVAVVAAEEFIAAIARKRYGDVLARHLRDEQAGNL